jgi:plasmid maintenance system antidote protein VapI
VRPAAPLAATIRELLASGLTIRDVAELLGAHPRAIEALIEG